MAANVKIALRVRPLSEKEQYEDKSMQGVVDVEDEKTVAITNLKVPCSNAGDSRSRIKRFNFDYCLDSTSSNVENYMNQEKVYEKLGAVVLESLARGQDACVLAYGQSSSGKTYTMQGSSSEPGLAPRLCQALMTEPGYENTEAIVSYFEIYNERVRDLLTADDEKSLIANRKDLRVREHPKKGPYVEALSGVLVRSAQELCSAWSSGTKRRRTASTASNVRSSRSHALLTIKRCLPHPPVTLTLLDLAGSERPSRVNQSLPRQKEGANINRSLVALANVISALVSAGSRGGRYVPYRDSVLTWLLKDTLSGRATTVMIATVSPSASCYSETVNTMRWASRAGKIPTNGPRNTATEPAHERSIRQLKAEVGRLKTLLAAATLHSVPLLQKTSDEMTSTANEETQDTSDISDCTVKEDKDHSSEGKANADSVDSLGSSRISVASTDTLSGNTTQTSNFNSNDPQFVPRLIRTGSVHEVKPLAPLRNKKRQYSSHETLPSSNDKSKGIFKSNGKSTYKTNDKSSGGRSESLKQRNTIYQPFNKRAVIVASVTDRLYSTMKKKEEIKPVKIEHVPEKRNSQTLTELEICNNARKTLFDISNKALKASRRFRSVPVETQTERPSILLFREIGTDVPDDIEPIELNTLQGPKLFRNTGTSTDTFAVLCKEASVGNETGSMKLDDKCIETDKVCETSFVLTRTCGNMTDVICDYSTIGTQTNDPVADTKKKHSSFTKYLRVSHDQNKSKDGTASGVLNISITHDCPFENDVDGISDDSLENLQKPSTSALITGPPDLLNNHNPIENDLKPDTIERPPRRKHNVIKFQKKEEDLKNNADKYVESTSDPMTCNAGPMQNSIMTQTVMLSEIPHVNEGDNIESLYNSKSTQASTSGDTMSNYADFMDDLYVPLPRVFFNPEMGSNRWPTMKNLIMGRNYDAYPYNIKMSPIRDKIKRKRYAKSVSWKSESKEATHLPSTSGNAEMKHSETETVDSDDTLSNAKDEKKSSNFEYFKGIHCWTDKSNEKQHDCEKYTRVTTNFLSEATNLVNALSKVSDKICDHEKISPNRNKQLRIQDEKAYGYDTSDVLLNCSHIINDALVNNDEHDKDDSYESEFQDIENNLLASLNRLQVSSKNSSEYFTSISDRYKTKVNRKLPDARLNPHPTSRRSPSRYLQQLLEMRKELVESTKRDEDISKQFQII